MGALFIVRAYQNGVLVMMFIVSSQLHVPSTGCLTNILYIMSWATPVSSNIKRHSPVLTSAERSAIPYRAISPLHIYVITDLSPGMGSIIVTIKSTFSRKRGDAWANDPSPWLAVAWAFQSLTFPPSHY